MADVRTNLERLMEKYFGDLGDTLLQKNMEVLGIKDLNTSSEEQRVELIENLLNECFSTIMSLSKRKYVLSKLISVLRISSSAFARNMSSSFDNARM